MHIWTSHACLPPRVFCVCACLHVDTLVTHVAHYPRHGFYMWCGPPLRPDSCVTRRWWQLLHRLSVVYGRPLSSPSPCLCLLDLWTGFISSVTLHDQTWDHNNNSFWLAMLPLAPDPNFSSLSWRENQHDFDHRSSLISQLMNAATNKMQIKCAKCSRAKGDVISDTGNGILFRPRARLTLMWALSPDRNWRWRRLSNLWDVWAEDVGTNGEL